MPRSPWKAASKCHQGTKGQCAGLGLSFHWASRLSLEAAVPRGGWASFLPVVLLTLFSSAPSAPPGQPLRKDLLSPNPGG